MLATIYFITFVISIVLFFLIIAATKLHKGCNYVICAMMTTLSTFGYWQITISHNVYEALLANKFAYLDGTFLLLTLVLSMAQLCKIKVSYLYILVMSILNILILGFVFTAGYNTLYYSKVDIAGKYGVTLLVTEHGPIHDLYYIVLAVYTVTIIGIVVYAFFHRNKVSYINIMLLMLVEITCIGTYMIENIFNIEIEILPFAYNINQFLLYIAICKTNLYDYSSNAENIHEKQKEYGYISFNKSGKYTGCNDVAREFITELNNVAIDVRIPQSEAFL